MKTTLRFGLYISLGVIAWTLIEFGLGLHNEHIQIGMITGMFSFIIPIILIYLGIKAHRDKDLNGNLSFIQGLKTGSGISLIMSVLITGFFILYLKVLNPGAVDALIISESQYYLEEADLSFVELMRILDFVKFVFSTTGIVLWSFFTPLLAGIGLSALYSKLLMRQIGLSSNGAGA